MRANKWKYCLLMLEVKKVFWVDIRNAMESLNPIFFELVDELSPDKQFPMYLVDYGYGDLVGDDEGIFIPTKKGQFVRLDSEYVSRSMFNDLGYGLNSSPLGMFFNKSFEWFLNTSNDKVHRIFPIYIDSPGVFFSIGHIKLWIYCYTFTKWNTFCSSWLKVEFYDS